MFAAFQPPLLLDRSSALEAARLAEDFGDLAGQEAAARADLARDRGNIANFCRWRAIERVVVLMGVGRAVGTVH